ncbi:hypothetical protein J8281_18760 [Aquimarina sp. U1-2]|uniref:hypothetical protein n=1 Tax=Aquimarina sp. U1-2 TaxID=2823141 RepID=UPI001AECEAE0|nr:hypothetical protein [Aquimarina sp. U1-2]MBP2834245.1 hypothetical protein [Aquimarina sp. U1-2]
MIDIFIHLGKNFARLPFFVGTAAKKAKINNVPTGHHLSTEAKVLNTSKASRITQAMFT